MLIDKQLNFLIIISDLDALRIWRFEDPILGPRKIPVLNEMLKGKVQLEDGVFSIDADKNDVFLEVDGSAKINVGSSFVYVVE